MQSRFATVPTRELRLCSKHAQSFAPVRCQLQITHKQRSTPPFYAEPSVCARVTGPRGELHALWRELDPLLKEWVIACHCYVCSSCQCLRMSPVQQGQSASRLADL